MDFEFDHIPSLKELIGGQGTPGFQYAQVCTHNLKRAQQDCLVEDDRTSGWKQLPGSEAYTITGPRGSADLVLMRRGSRIPGVSGDSGARHVFADPDILKLTGLNPNPQVLKEPTDAGVSQSSAPKGGAVPAGKGQSGQGDARVQSGKSS